MNKKSILFLSIFTFVAVAVTGGVLWYMNEVKKEAEMAQKQVEEDQKKMEEAKQEEKFVVDVDMNVENWQTNEYTFDIKFPKEWYWMESDLKKTGYHSQVITNNPIFDIDKYADIGISAGDDYPFVLRDNMEVVITFNGAPTSNAGSALKSMDSVMELNKKNHPSIVCMQPSNNKKPPLTAYCSFMDKYGYKIQKYFLVNEESSLAITIRTTEDTLVKKEILDKIVASIDLDKYSKK